MKIRYKNLIKSCTQNLGTIFIKTSLIITIIIIIIIIFNNNAI